MDLLNDDFGRARKPKDITRHERKYGHKALKRFRKLHAPERLGEHSSARERYNIIYPAIFSDRNLEQPTRPDGARCGRRENS